jgi:flagellar M-ring protein FliF
VAVLVDNMHKTGTDGKVTEQPLSKEQIDGITQLVKNAVGFDEARGDSVNVVNQSFLEVVEPPLKPETIPIWQRPMVLNMVRLVLGALVLVALALGVLRPLIKNLASHAVSTAPQQLLAAGAGGDGEARAGAAGAAATSPALAYEQQIVQARTLVGQDPKRVAQVVKTWVGES